MISVRSGIVFTANSLRTLEIKRNERLAAFVRARETGRARPEEICSGITLGTLVYHS